MQVDTKILKELAKIAPATKDNRPALSMVRLDGFNGKARLWATDGHCLVVHELDAPAPDAGVSYSLDHIKSLSSKDIIYLEGNALTDSRGQLPLADNQSAPDINCVIPEKNEGSSPPSIGFTPKLLQRVMGVVSKIPSLGTVVEFNFGSDNLSPVIATMGATMAVIMPARLD